MPLPVHPAWAVGLMIEQNPRRLAERLAGVRVRDLLRPSLLEEVRELAAFATRAHHRSLEGFFFSNDTSQNRLGRDGFFDAVAAVRAYRRRTPRTGGRLLPSENVLSIDFHLLPGEDVEKWSARLAQVVDSFNGSFRAEDVLVAEAGEP